jgi:hypothetical protein
MVVPWLVPRYWPRFVGVTTLADSLASSFLPTTYTPVAFIHCRRPSMTSNLKQPYKIEQLPASRLPHPSFTLVLSQSRDPPGLLDYYRTLHREKYGPHGSRSMSGHEFMVSYTSYVKFSEIDVL